MCVDGTGPKYIKLGKGRRAKVVYRVSDLDTYVEEQEGGSTSEDNRPKDTK